MEKICLKCSTIENCIDESKIHACNAGCHNGLWIGQPKSAWLCETCKDDYVLWISSRIYEYILLNNQPERSKREDSQKCEMRCSEHCGQRSEG